MTRRVIQNKIMAKADYQEIIAEYKEQVRVLKEQVNELPDACNAKDFFYPEPKKTDEAPLPTEGGEVWQKTSLPPTSMPKVAQIPPQTNPQTGLTRTESALLSPSEQVIARRP